MSTAVSFVVAHWGYIAGVSGYFLLHAGITLPDIGTAQFWKVWAHDLFQSLTVSKKK